MTKKSLLLIVFISCSLWTFAQDVLMPQKGSFSLEVGFNPFSNNFETFKFDGAKLNGRYFIGDKDALRLGVGFGFNSVNDRIEDEDHYEKFSYHATRFAVDLGYEHHWATSKRVDLYVAAIAGYEMKCNKEINKYIFYPEVTSEVNSVTIKNGNIDNPSYDKFYVTLGTGINFYIVKGLYLGAELGLQMNHTNYRDEVIENGWGDNKETTPNYLTETSVKLDVKPSLHLGWTF